MNKTWPVSNKKFDEHVNDTTKHISVSKVKTICIGFPDYSNAEEITITRTDGYEVTENGWISVWCSGSGTVTVNGVVMASCHTYADAWAYAQQSIFPVSKGDIVETTGTDRKTNVWFIPCK